MDADPLPQGRDPWAVPATRDNVEFLAQAILAVALEDALNPNAVVWSSAPDPWLRRAAQLLSALAVEVPG
jgi:hypothetical protein